MKVLLFRFTFLVLLIASSICYAFGQNERLTNLEIIQLSKSGLGKELIINKIKSSECSFDVSVSGLIELKNAGIDDVIVAVMVNRAEESKTAAIPTDDKPGADAKPADPVRTAKEALLSAKTMAIGKSSLNPSRQALEKELLKRPEWKKFNLTLTRYEDTADIYIDIGFVHGSFITHRYVYRIYDRRTGTVIAAGETTSWGSLAENLSKHIVKSLDGVLKS